MRHEKYLNLTIEMAVENVKNGGGPYGSIVVRDDKIIGRGTNLVHVQNDPSAHAEMLAIKEACAHLGSMDLSDCILYASGEPCPMCLGASYWSSVGTIYYACTKKEAGVSASDPLASFFPDRSKEPENRTVPIIHHRTERSLEPFSEWNRLHS